MDSLAPLDHVDSPVRPVALDSQGSREGLVCLVSLVLLVSLVALVSVVRLDDQVVPDQMDPPDNQV